MIKKKYIIFLFLHLFLVSCGNSTRLFPRKLTGNYIGIQPAFTLQINNKFITVPKENIEVTMDNGLLFLTSPSKHTKARFTIEAETKMYYALDVAFSNGQREIWKLFKKGKQLIRIPTSPLPKTIFLKN